MRRSLFSVLVMAGLASPAGIAMAQPPAGADGLPGASGFMRALPLMVALDADQDGEISRDEIKKSAAALKGLDKDHNGKLTEDELRPDFGGGGFGGDPGFRDGRGGFGPPRGRPTPEDLVARVMEYDRNKDEKLAADELPERLQSLLGRADADKDGFVSKEELLKTYEQESRGGEDGPPPGDRGGFRGGFGGPPGPEMLVNRALEFDANKDGMLDKEELTKWAEQFGRGSFGGDRRNREGQGRRPQRPQRPDSE